MVEEKIFYDTYKYGEYYNPANKHYNGQEDVGCDRCQKTNITVCIGYRDIDLCLKCVSDINTKYENEELVVYDDSD
jgi:hypothetical protein